MEKTTSSGPSKAVMKRAACNNLAHRHSCLLGEHTGPRMTTGINEAIQVAGKYPGENHVTTLQKPTSTFAGDVTQHSVRGLTSFVSRTISAKTFACAAALSLTAAPAYASGQLVLFPDPPILITLLIGFVLLIAPLNAMIFRPLFRVLDERDAKIAGATREADQLVKKAAELTEQYRASIRGAREDAEGGRKEQLEEARAEQSSITDDARAEYEDEIARARAEIQTSVSEARVTLEAASHELAAAAAERILGRAL
jgi:F-type H+-transporting ATPase subunit b